MATLYVRRSGRLYNQKAQINRDDDDEVIDLTTEEWEGVGDEIISNGSGEAANKRTEEVEEIDVTSMKKGVVETSDNREEGIGIELENIEKGVGEEKTDGDNTEVRKGEYLTAKQKLAALVEKFKKQKVVRKGKLDALVKKSKKTAGKGFYGAYQLQGRSMCCNCKSWIH